MNTSEILAKAADLIEERGWNQGWYVNDCGGLCATGAMYAAAGLKPLPEHAATAFETFDEAAYTAGALAWTTFGDFIGRFVPTWNDEEERTKEEVVDALRRAAEAARAET